jgi:hypothetical protein
MKALNILASKDQFRPCMNYIQLKDGFFNVTNGHVLMKSPVNEIFPDTIYEKLPGECYFLASEWKNSKIEKAVYYKFENNIIECLDSKFKNLGYLKFLDIENFEKEIGRYPNTENVWPVNAAEIDKISFNPGLLNDIYIANNKEKLYLEFYGKNYGIIIKFENSETKALLMPMTINF